MSPETLEDQACSEAINSDSETSFRFESVSDGNFEMGEIESTSFTDGKHVSLKPADPLASFKLCSESFGSEYSAGARNDRPSTGTEYRIHKPFNDDLVPYFFSRILIQLIKFCKIDYFTMK